jgi:hypothetical protein
MAEKSDDPRKPITADPKAIRAEITKTRTALEQKLGELKSRFLNPRPTPEKRTKTMATKKATGTAVAKKKPAASVAKAGTTVKKTVGKAVKKTKEVLGDMLAGAAVGAVKGAAEAVEPKGKKRGK